MSSASSAPDWSCCSAPKRTSKSLLGRATPYTIHQPLKLVQSGRLDPKIFATHHFALADTMSAYDTFADAASTHALKVVLEGGRGRQPQVEAGLLQASA